MTIPDANEKAAERQVLGRAVELIIRRRMAVPAMFVLESVKPLSFVASQALVFLEPIVQPVLSIKDYDIFARAIEDRDNLEWMIQQLEAAEDARAWRRAPDSADPDQAP